MKDETLISKHPFYCYDCPYWREDKTIKTDLYGFGYIPSVWCDFLEVNSAVLDFNGKVEPNGWKCYQAHLLNDMCKICNL